MKIDYTYTNIIKDIFKHGYKYEDPNRKNVYRKELEFAIIEHFRTDGYPIITARKTFFKGAVGELLLFLKGSTDIRDFWKYKIRFWDKDFARYQNYSENFVKEKLYPCWKRNEETYSEKKYDMGKIYSYQYKKQHSIFNKFKENPLRTDLIVNSWQLNDLKDMALIPCHYDFQIVGSNDGFIIVWNQRSTDILLGTPINVQFYYLMGLLLEKWSGHMFNGVVGILKKVHLYDNGFDLAERIVNITEEKYYRDIVVDIEVNNDDKNLPFGDFIKKIEPSNFKMINYNYIIDDKVEMLTYKK